MNFQLVTPVAKNAPPWHEQMRCYEIFKQENGKVIVTVPCQLNSPLHVFVYWPLQDLASSKQGESSQRTTSEAGSSEAKNQQV